MKLLVDDRSWTYRLHSRRLGDAAKRMAASLRLPEKTVISLVLCPVRTLSRLGARHFGRASTTDVIAFPTGFAEFAGLLGEIWIAPDTVAKNGEKFGKGLNGELLFVFAHGMLHLLGEDDDTPAKREAMFRKQEKLLAACRGPGGELPVVIARTSVRPKRTRC